MKKWSTPLLILLFLLGLALVLYPTVSNAWNARHQTQLISAYTNRVDGSDEDALRACLEEARAYNAAIRDRRNLYLPTPEEKLLYPRLLDISGTGIMGTVEIPVIGVELPIYHGTDEGVLQIAAGHADWTALPVGGEGTHCVLSGHRGLPRARLFTDLDRLQKGDLFIIRVLQEVLTYEVDQILTVLPDETEALLPVEGQDLCTLVTCTPYGINTHRLLVRGHRVENAPGATSLRVTADAVLIRPVQVAPLLALPLLALLFLLLLLPQKRKK